MEKKIYGDSFPKNNDMMCIKRKIRFLIMCTGALLVTRVIFLIFVSLSEIPPYLCYDEENVYAQVKGIEIEYMVWIKARQIYYILSSWMNYFYINEFINLSRTINIALLGMTCLEVRKTTDYFEWPRHSAKVLSVCILLAPYYLFCTSFRIKDILCMYLTCKLLNYYFYYLKRNKIKWLEAGLYFLVLWGVRWGVAESILLICLGEQAWRNKKKRMLYLLTGGVILAAVFCIAFSNATYRSLFSQKLLYFSFDIESTGFLSHLVVRNVKEIYKLVLLLPFTLVMPIGNWKIWKMEPIYWSNIMGLFSFVQFFLLPSFYYYIFRIRKTEPEKLAALFFCIWHIVLSIASPHNFRHLIFITPFFYMFSIRALMGKRKKMLLAAGLVMEIFYISYYFL